MTPDIFREVAWTFSLRQQIYLDHTQREENPMSTPRLWRPRVVVRRVSNAHCLCLRFLYPPPSQHYVYLLCLTCLEFDLVGSLAGQVPGGRKNEYIYKRLSLTIGYIGSSSIIFYSSFSTKVVNISPQINSAS